MLKKLMDVCLQQGSTRPYVCPQSIIGIGDTVISQSLALNTHIHLITIVSMFRSGDIQCFLSAGARNRQ